MVEAIVIIVAVAIVVLVFGSYFYKKIKGEPTGTCSCCKSGMKRNFKKISNELDKEKKCNCGCNK